MINQAAYQDSLRTRVLRVLTPAVMLTFMLLGLGAAIIVVSNAMGGATRAQRAELTASRDTFTRQFAALLSSARELASEPTVQQATLSGATDSQAASRARALLNARAAQAPVALVGARVVSAGGDVVAAVSTLGTLPTTSSVQAGAPRPPVGTYTFSTVDANASSPFVTLILPVNRPSDLMVTTGYIELDVPLNSLVGLLRANPLLVQQGRVAVLQDANGTPLAQTQNITEGRQALLPTTPLNGAIRLLGGTPRLVTGVTLLEGAGANSPWVLSLADLGFSAIGGALLGALALLGGSVGAGALMVALLHRGLGRALAPLQDVEDAARQLALGDTPIGLPSATLQDDRTTTEPNTDALQQALAQVGQRVQQAQERASAQSRRYARSLRVAARLSRETATLRDLDALLLTALELITDEHGFQQANVFLADDTALMLTLMHSHTQGGAPHATPGLQVPTDDSTVVGQVMLTAQPVLLGSRPSGDVTSHPALHADAQTALLLPLLAGRDVLGVLDVQSQQQGVFQDDDMQTLQMLADQLAVAVYNAQMLRRTEQRIEQVESLNRQLTRIAWEEISTEYGLEPAYSYARIEGADALATTTDNVLRLPIMVRGEVIATLAAAPPPAQTFTDGDAALLRAVADRVALSVENARLFQEAQASLDETTLLYRTNRFLNEAASLEDVLESVALSALPGVVSAAVAIVADDDEQDDDQPWLLVSAAWVQDAHASIGAPLNGLRLPLDQLAPFETLADTPVLLVQDVHADTRLSETARALLAHAAGRSAAVLALSVRGTWRGVLFFTYPEPRSFTEREGRVLLSLVDQMGIVVDNRLLQQATSQALAQNERLYAASRYLTQAVGADDLVQAALRTSASPDVNFGLLTFEAPLDAEGWPTRLRLTAQSRRGAVFTPAARSVDIAVPAGSPLRQRAPLVVLDKDDTAAADTPDVEALRAVLRSNGDRYGLFFPLFSAEQLTALFCVSRAAMREFSAQDMETYRALTGQMSTVLENQRLLSVTNSALGETRRLYTASREIAAAADTRSVFDAMAEYLAAASAPLYRVTVWLAQPEPSLAAPYLDNAYVWERGLPSAYPPLDQQRLLTEVLPLPTLLAQTDGQRIMPVAALDPVLGEWLTARNAEGALLVQLRARQSWLGVLLCELGTADALDDAFVTLTAALADQVAIAAENQRLFEEAQQQARQALALAEASQVAGQLAGTLEDNLRALFERVALAAGYDRWTLIERRGQDWYPYLLQVEGSAIPTTGMPPLSAMDAAPIQLITQTRQPLVINDLDALARTFDMQQVPTALGKHILAPVLLGDRVLGALTMGRPLDAPDLADRDEQLIRTMAAQVAVALENARLFREAEDERRTLSSILATMPVGVLVLDAATMQPVQANARAESILRQPLAYDAPFTAQRYALAPMDDSAAVADEHELATVMARDTQDGSITTSEHRITTPGGGVVFVTLSAAPLPDATGAITTVVAALEDNTTQRRLEQSLQQTLHDTLVVFGADQLFAAAPDTDAVLDAAVVKLTEFQPDWLAVVLLEPQGVRVARHTGMAVRLDALPGELLDPTVAYMLPDVNSPYTGLTDDQRNALRAEGLAAFFTAPLVASGRATPVGWVVLGYHALTPAVDEAERLLVQIIPALALSLENRLLLVSQRSALDEALALYNATSAISRVQSLEQLGQVLGNALSFLQPDVAAAFMIQDADSHEPVVVPLYSTPGATLDVAELMLRSPLEDTTTLFVEDLADAYGQPFLEALREEGGLRAVAAVTMRLIGQPVGRLLVGYRQPRAFADGDARYLSTVADSASVLANNLQLLEQIQESLEETSTLYQANRSLVEATTPQDLLGVVVDKLATPAVTQVLILTLNGRTWQDPNASATVTATWRGSDDGIDLRNVTLSADQFPAWALLASHEVVTIDDVQTTRQMDELTRLGVGSLGVRSLVIIPLRSINRNIGAVWLGSPQPHIFSDAQKRVLSAFAEQASLSLEAAYLLQQAERRARQLRAAADVSRAVVGTLALDELLPTFVNLIRDQLGYNHAQVFLMDDQNDYALLSASTGEAGRKLLAIGHKLRKGSASVIGQVTVRAEPVLAADTADTNVVHRPNAYLPLTRSELAIPIIVDGKLRGAVDVQSNQPNAFNDDDIAVLITLSAQLSNALQNVSLYREADKRANDMSFLFTLASVAASADTLEGALGDVARLVQEAQNATACAIYITDRYEDPTTNTAYTLLRAVATAGADEQPLNVLDGVRAGDLQHLIGMVAGSLFPHLIIDADYETAYTRLSPYTSSGVLIPLTNAGDLIGMLAVEGQHKNEFDQDSVTLLLALSGTLSAIIQNARLLEQLRATNDQLRTLDRLKSDFLANMSHELRTPLNSIIGFSRVMLKGIDGPLTEMQEQDLSTIYTSGQHLLGLINDVLDQAKIAANKMELQFSHFDLRPLVEGVRSIGVGLVKEKPIEMVAEVAPGLPRAYGDEFRTRQVLLNLVSNACKFTNQGRVVIRAYPVREGDATVLRVDVEDTGIGIAEHDLPALFEAFRQVDSSLTRVVEGTGLGLPIARSLVELQGGRMMVQSIPSAGSVFSVTIPTTPTPAVERPAASPTPTPLPSTETTSAQLSVFETGEIVVDKDDTQRRRKTAAPPRTLFTQKRQVLMMENSSQLVEQLRTLLTREGFEVFAASVPLEAEAMASGLRPTLIVMDVAFANGEGWNILGRIKDRDDTFDIPVIVVTLSEETERAYQLGAFKVLQRPFAPEEFTSTVLDAERQSNVDRILIIDDQPGDTRLLETLLNDHGSFRVFAAHTGPEGISMVARRRPDLIILDLRMPGMDGFGVLEQLRATPETATIPVLVVTAESTLTADEREQLTNLRVVYKTDLNQDNYTQFMAEVRDLLAGANGGD